MKLFKTVLAWLKDAFRPARSSFDKFGGLPEELKDAHRYPIRTWRDIFVLDKASYEIDKEMESGSDKSIA